MTLLKEHSVHTAHELRTSKKQYTLVRGFLKAAGLEDRFKYKENNQEISITNPDNGASIIFIARTNDGGRGLSEIDVIYLDEALKLDEENLAALLPIQAARSMSGHVQTWYTSSAGKLSSEILAEVRATCLTDPRGWTYYEWSCPEDVDITDPVNWALANPSYMIPGHGISYDFLLGQLQKAATKFGREHLGIWDEAKVDTVIAPGLWNEGNTLQDPISDEIVLSVAVSRSEPQVATVGLATAGPNGTYVKVLDQREGLDWVPDYINLIKTAKTVKDVVIDAGGQHLNMVQVLTKAKIKFTPLSSVDCATACQGFLSDIHTKKLSHTNDEATRLVVISAGKRESNGKWYWNQTSHDVAPLNAMTFAHFGWSKLFMKPERKPVRLLSHLL